MGKLYPPIIAGTVPAFTGTTLVVPFSMNRSVSLDAVKGFYLMIKTVSGRLLYTKPLYVSKGMGLIIEDGFYKANFNISSIPKYQEKFNIGQHYKIQLAYENDQGTIGYYSTVGVIKYTSEPSVKILDLNTGELNIHKYRYVGIYSNIQDPTESLYSGRFQLLDENNEILQDSGEMFYNIINSSTNGQNEMEYEINKDLESDSGYYKIVFTTTSINGLVRIVQYRLGPQRNYIPEFSTELIAENDFEEGRMKLYFNNPSKDVITGAFLITRAIYKEPYEWEEIKRVSFVNIDIRDWYTYDYSIEQGIKYIYSLQEYNSLKNNLLYSERILSKPVYADFEDMFLYDGERQLKIRFDPKMTSFKRDILESKTDTIGSKYPFFFRNGYVDYKEFPLSGLISYQMDEAQLFMSKKELDLEYQRLYRTNTFSEERENKIAPLAKDLLSENFRAERIFKNEVLDYLTNGQPKLLRTPSEGNYVVKLMNVSLSPQDRLARMIHSFNCTAYECAPNLLSSLKELNLIQVNESLSQMGEAHNEWKTIPLSKFADEYDPTSTDIVNILEGGNYINEIELRDLMPGTSVFIGNGANLEEIVIGSTGYYHFESDERIGVVGIPKNTLINGLSSSLFVKEKVQGVVSSFNTFSMISDIEFNEIPIKQFMKPSNNIIDDIENIKTKIVSIYYLKLKKKDVLNVYIDKNNLPKNQTTLPGDLKIFFDPLLSNPVEKIEPHIVYKLYTGYEKDYSNQNITLTSSPYSGIGKEDFTYNEGYWIDKTIENYTSFTGFYIYYENNKYGWGYSIGDKSEELFQATIEGSTIDLTDSNKFIIPDKMDIKNLKINTGVLLDMGYLIQNTTYNLEEQNASVKQAKNMYENAKNDYINYPSYTGDKIEEIYNLENDFLSKLEGAIEKYKEVNGII